MPGPSGIEVASQLSRSGFGGKVVIVTTFDRPGYLRAAMTAGASGFLLKDAPAADLAAAIRQVAAGERVVDPSLAAAALAQGDSPLTDRESRGAGRSGRSRRDRRHRRPAASVAGHGAQPPVRRDPEARRPEPRRGRADGAAEGLAVVAMLLDSVVRTSAAVAATPGRLAKIDQIAALLGECPAEEIAVAVSFLSGDLTQRQIGVGYAALTDLLGGYGQPRRLRQGWPQAPAVAELTLTETDQALGRIGDAGRPGLPGRAAAAAGRPAGPGHRGRSGSSWSGCWPVTCVRARWTG